MQPSLNCRTDPASPKSVDRIALSAPKYDLAAFSRWLMEKTGYRIVNPDLFMTALTHRSEDRRPGRNYERMEFLGDAVANLSLMKLEAAAHALYPLRQILGRPKADLFWCNKWFERGSRRSGLMSFGISHRSNVFLPGTRSGADLLESVAAATYLDSGSFPAAERFVGSVLSELKPFRRLKAEAEEVRKLELCNELALPNKFKAFASVFFPIGTPLGDAACCLLTPMDGRAELRLLELYRLGNCVHQLLAKEWAYVTYPAADETALWKKADRLGKDVLRTATLEPVWSPILELMPEARREIGRVGDLESRIRFFGLLGALFLAGGLSWVHERMGSLYWREGRGCPPPGLCALASA